MLVFGPCASCCRASSLPRKVVGFIFLCLPGTIGALAEDGLWPVHESRVAGTIICDDCPLISFWFDQVLIFFNRWDVLQNYIHWSTICSKKETWRRVILGGLWERTCFELQILIPSALPCFHRISSACSHQKSRRIAPGPTESVVQWRILRRYMAEAGRVSESIWPVIVNIVNSCLLSPFSREQPS